jgi:hypothetical protein
LKSKKELRELAREFRKEGHAWGESGRSEYDVIAVVDFFKLEIPNDITSEFRAHEDALYERLGEALDDDDQFERLLNDRTYREGWVDGVMAFYHETTS